MKLAFLFPGQGSQAVGMADDFRRGHPLVAERLRQAGEMLGMDLAAVSARGPPVQLAKTHVAQPAIFAMSYAIAELLAARGVEAALVAGHSLGEFTAAAAARAMRFEDALELVIARGRLMHEANQAADGAMLAVSGLDRAAVQEVLRAGAAAVTLANRNAPTQLVLSGPRADLRPLNERLTARGGRCQWLDVAGAYHSPLMATAAATFAGRVDAAAIADPAVPLVANASAALLADAAALRRELAQHMLAPVDWAATLQRLGQESVTGLIEVGPGRVLKGLALRNVPRLKCWTTGGARELDEACRAWESAACAST